MGTADDQRKLHMSMHPSCASLDPGSWRGLNTRAEQWLQPLEELRFALAEAAAQSATLRSRTISRVMAGRARGRGGPDPAALTPVESFVRSVEAFDSLLAILVREDWGRRALRDLDVQGLVGHLIGVEHDFQAALRPGAEPGPGDHVASTQKFATAQAGLAGLQTQRAWDSAVRTTLERLAGLSGFGLAEPVTLHGITLPLGLMLVLRSFEMWIHEEDIRKATGRPLSAPEPARLAPMIQLAVSLLQGGLARAGRLRPGRRAKLVVTGPAGGTFLVPLGPGGDGPAEVRVAVEGEAFCRLAAGRLDPDDVATVVSGEEELACDLIAGVAALAVD